MVSTHLPAWLHGRLRAVGRLLRVLLVGLAVAGLTPAGALLDAMHEVISAPDEHLAGVGCASDCEDDCEQAGCHGAVHHCGCCQVPRDQAAGLAWAAWMAEGRALAPDPSRVPPAWAARPDLPPPRA